MRHIRGRPSNYRKSLQNNKYWNTVKRKVRIRDNFKCLVCGCKIRLEVHHITYYVNGKSILNKELEFLVWMVTLCEKDHDKAHKQFDHPFNPNNPKKLNADEYKRRKNINRADEDGA